MDTHGDVRVAVRVDRELKEQAEALFERLGMNMSTAMNVFLRKAVDEDAIPFPVSIRRATFAGGYSSAAITDAFSSAVESQIAEAQRDGYPVARYDTQKREAYLELADGTREYIDG